MQVNRETYLERRESHSLCAGADFETKDASFRTSLNATKMSSNSSKRITFSDDMQEADGSNVSFAAPLTCILAITEGRGWAKGEVGLAAFDTNASTLYLSQFSDNSIYARLFAKLDAFNPSEIVLPANLCEQKANLVQHIQSNFHNAAVVGVDRKFFNETVGSYLVNRLCSESYNVLSLDLANKYYCLSAAAALLKYVEHIKATYFEEKSLKIVYSAFENNTLIDFTSSRSLEIITNQIHSQSKMTLFGVLNFTKTRCGQKLLRATLSEPPCDKDTITARLDCVEELVTSPSTTSELSVVLKKMPDVDTLISMLSQRPKIESLITCERRIDAVIHLKHVFSLLPGLREILSNLRHPLFEQYRAGLESEEFNVAMAKINDVILQDCKLMNGISNVRQRKIFAIKSGTSVMLDVARQTYNERISDVTDMLAEVSERSRLPLRLKYAVLRGYYFQINMKEANIKATKDLPSEFIKVTKSGNYVNFVTQDLMNANNRINLAISEVFTQAKSVVSALFKELRVCVNRMLYLSEIVAYLDLLVAFAEAATTYGFVRPTFSEHLGIDQGWHPFFTKMTNAVYAANDTYLSPGNNIWVLTGPNMSGKSTYMKQVALLQIMAQCGSFVSAQKATFRLVNQIFTRTGSNDDIDSNSSTFMLEARETNYILQNITPHSLVIIDELGRGTSVEEGVCFCIAVAEHLVRKQALTLLATHFMELTELASIYPTVKNYQFVTEINKDENGVEKVTFTHKLKKGICQEKDYGLRLLKMMGLPEGHLEEITTLESEIPNISEVEEAILDFGFGYHLRLLASKAANTDEDKLVAHIQSLPQHLPQRES